MKKTIFTLLIFALGFGLIPNYFIFNKVSVNVANAEASCPTVTIDNSTYRLEPCNMNFEMVDGEGNKDFQVKIVQGGQSTLYGFQRYGYGVGFPTYAILGDSSGGVNGTDKILSFSLQDSVLNSDGNQNKVYSGYLPIQIFHGSWNGVYEELKLNLTVTVKPESFVEPFVYNVGPEWKFISPVTNLMIGQPILNFFPNLENVYYYDNGYKQANNFEMGKGYWLKNKTSQTIYATGTPITSVTYNLPAQGQHLIGAPFLMNLSDVPCVIDVLHYNSQTNTYDSNFEIAKGSAAFVKTNGSCSFTKLIDRVKVVISAPTVTDITSSSAKVSYSISGTNSTNPTMCFGTIDSSVNNCSGMSVVAKPDGTFETSYNFSGLQPNTKYFYQLILDKSTGFEIKDKVYSFVTSNNSSYNLFVTSPVKGIKWYLGEKYSINWKATDVPADYMVGIMLSNNGLDKEIINCFAKIPVSQNSFEWVVPKDQLIGEKYTIKLGIYKVDSPQNACVGQVPMVESDYFSILKEKPVVGDNNITSPYLFALNGQEDKEGKVNSDIYASFNRMILGGRVGKGVEKVKINLILPTMGPTEVSDDCELDLIKNSNTCQSLEAVGLVNNQANNQAVLKIDMSKNNYESLRFDVTYSSAANPTDYTVDIGDSISNDGWGGDAGHQTNDAEVQIYNTHLSIFGNDNTVGERRLYNLGYYVSAGDTVSITVRNNSVQWSKVKSAIADVVVPDSVSVEKPIAEIKEKATLLYEGEISSILSELNTVRDTVREQEIEIKYLRALIQNLAQVNESMKEMINHFITYGVDTNSMKLGEGERAAVVYSFKEAFGKLPESEVDFEDVIKIANGRWPEKKSDQALASARAEFAKIYQRADNANNPNDQAAVTIMAYGLRQKAENRNLLSEQNGLKIFAELYDKNPQTTTDWNILQAITYSGATREVIDTDKDGLSDEMEKRLGTDPKNSDTDGDSYLDGQEVVHGYNPLQKAQ